MYLSKDPEATVVRAAREANAGMPEYAVGRLEEEYGDLRGAKVAVLGASYRGGVKETAFSGTFPLVEALQSRGAVVMVHDPMYTDEELESFGWEPCGIGDPVDSVIVQADHGEYRHLRLKDFVGAKVLLDGRRWLVASPEALALGDGGKRDAG